MSAPFDVVVAGAGVAGLEAALALRALAEGRVSVEIVDPVDEFVYRPLAVAEPFRIGEVKRFPLERLVAAAGATLRRGSLAAVDATAKTAVLDDGTELPYDALVLALGALPREAVPGALTFRGPHDGGAVTALLESVAAGDVHRIAFVAPTGVGWPLPLYELALLAAEFVTDHCVGRAEVVLATPEDRPLEVFGAAASEAVQELLDIRSVAVETNAAAVRFSDGVLELAGGGRIEADAAVALPALEGPSIEGVPRGERGFVATDEFGWVLGLNDVYAAGDITQFPVKQGGLATQQADAVACSIAADAGASVRPAGFRPVLRGLLLTGLTPRYLRSDAGPGRSAVDTEPLWWPPAKIVGRYLAPFLAAQTGVPEDLRPPADARTVPVEVELDRTARSAWSPV